MNPQVDDLLDFFTEDEEEVDKKTEPDSGDDSIFSLYEEEGKEDRLKAIAAGERPYFAQKAREVGMGIGQGVLDTASLVNLGTSALTYPSRLGLTEAEAAESATESQQLQAQQATRTDLSPMQEVAALTGDDDILPERPPVGGAAAVQEITEQIPEEGNVQEMARRATRSAPALIASPAAFLSVLGRETAGLTGKNVAQKLGLGRTGQDIFDLLFSIAPAPTKLIKGTDRLIRMAATGQTTTQKELIEAARRMGWSEEAIAPLVRDGWFSNIIDKVATRGAATKRAVANSRKAASAGYDVLAARPEAGNAVTGPARTQFLRDFQALLAKQSESAKEVIQKDVQKLLTGPITGEKMMNFWSAIGEQHQSFPKLGSLRGPIRRAMYSVDSSLAKDFEMANTLSLRSKEAVKRLGGSRMNDFIRATEGLELLHSIGTFNFPAAVGTMGLIGARKVADLMARNPRFINLHKKMLTSITNGQVDLVKRLYRQITDLISKEDPEAGAILRTEDLDKLDEFKEED